MMPWFIWKGKNSIGDYGLWINKLPPIVRAKERTEEVTIPGRAGSLTLLEGEDIYDPVVRKCTVLMRNRTNKIQSILEWLRGSGELSFSNELDRVYFARIAAEVSFSRISNDLSQATISFQCEPLKARKSHLKDSQTFNAGGNIYNPGDVASKPEVAITKSGTGSVSVSIGGNSMTFSEVNGTIVVDCESEIVTKTVSGGRQLYTGTVTGDFWRIPKGTAAVTIGAADSVTINPKWRWV